MCNTKCTWMGIPLRSPIILASLTLFSKPNISKHIAYFKQAQQYGVGAIVLPSIHPLRKDESIGNPHVRVTPVNSGLGKPTEYLGFSILGTTDNIVSISYGLELAKEAVALGIPILGSVANIGSKDDFLGVVKQLSDIEGLAGLELNFSCPNVHNGLPLSPVLLDDVCKIAGKVPISIKFPPNTQDLYQQEFTNYVSGITCSNAYLGLVPPLLNLDQKNPFGTDVPLWRPTGIYGPQEKLLTFFDIWKIKSHTELRNMQLSAVGGFVSSEDVIQAILLGADTVQLSSAVFWNGLKIIHQCNEALGSYLRKNNCSLDEMRGSSLPMIKQTDSDLSLQRPVRTMKVDADRCLRCGDCACVDHGCYAFQKHRDECAEIIQDLCNGCGWCLHKCIHHAVKVNENI